jgi:hypothetical protein
MLSDFERLEKLFVPLYIVFIFFNFIPVNLPQQSLHVTHYLILFGNYEYEKRSKYYFTGNMYPFGAILLVVLIKNKYLLSPARTWIWEMQRISNIVDCIVARK